MTLYAESNSAKIIPKEGMRQSELYMWRISYDIMVFCILVRASWHDLQHKRIPDRCCIWLAGIGLVRIFVCPECTWSICRGLLGAAAGSVPMFLATLVAPGAFGGGDIKLMAAAGIGLGPKGSLTGLLIGVTAAGCYGAAGVLLQHLRLKDRIVFGPFLSVGIGIAYLLF